MSESTTDIRILPPPNGQDVLNEVVREGARRLLAQAVQAEAAASTDAHPTSRTSPGGGRSSVTAASPSGPSRPASAQSRPSIPGSMTGGPRGNGRRSRTLFCPGTCGGPVADGQKTTVRRKSLSALGFGWSLGRFGRLVTGGSCSISWTLGRYSGLGAMSRLFAPTTRSSPR
jgi:hypothetical protein